MIYWYVLRDFFLSVATEGLQKSHQPGRIQSKVRVDGLVLSEIEMFIHQGKPILQSDLKFSNSNSNCGQKSAGCSAQFRWRTNAWEFSRRINLSWCA